MDERKYLVGFFDQIRYCQLNFDHCCDREYNFQSIVSASSIVYGFLCGAPAAVWFVFKQIDPTLKFVTIFCLYGYSLVIFAPAVVSDGALACSNVFSTSRICVSTAHLLDTIRRSELDRPLRCSGHLDSVSSQEPGPVCGLGCQEASGSNLEWSRVKCCNS